MNFAFSEEQEELRRTVRGFLEPSVQQAFFTFSSQEKRSGTLTRLYAWWLLGQLGLTLVLIGIAVEARLVGQLWPGQRLDQIVWVTLLDWIMFLALSLQQLGDSKGLTIWPQVVRNSRRREDLAKRGLARPELTPSGAAQAKSLRYKNLRNQLSNRSSNDNCESSTYVSLKSRRMR